MLISNQWFERIYTFNICRVFCIEDDFSDVNRNLKLKIIQIGFQHSNIVTKTDSKPNTYTFRVSVRKIRLIFFKMEIVVILRQKIGAHEIRMIGRRKKKSNWNIAFEVKG